MHGGRAGELSLGVSNSVFTESDFSYSVFKNLLPEASLSAQDGNDFLMTLRGLGSRQW